MNAIITYSELSQYVEKEFGVNVSFSQIDDKTIKVSTSIKKMLIALPVHLTLKVEQVSESSIKLSHGGGIGVDAILLGAVAYLRTRNNEIDKIVRYDGNHTIEGKLNEIPQLKSAFDLISLKNITFSSLAVEINLSLK